MLEFGHRHDLKNHVYAVVASVAKALGNGHRLELLELLAQCERPVEDLAREAGLSVANTSQHLQVMRRAGLVTARRDGVRIHYRLASDTAADLWRALRQFAERELPQIDRIVKTYAHARESLEPIGLAELRQRLGEGDIVLLDVRPVAEFDAGHIPGARSIPVDELPGRLDELPAGDEIAAYCRGRYCVFADDAVRLLRAKGFQARRVEGDVADWRRASAAAAGGGR
jgi:rhodanese-related sulfurtransferase/DNA-binding MarR family transcriptional regulator